jgi:L-ascorbate metabolism protein UlaG (beta-lactamase superfamily)
MGHGFKCPGDFAACHLGICGKNSLMSFFKSISISTLAFAFIAFTLGSTSGVLQAEDKLTHIRWFGHAAFEVTTPNGKIFFIDPWITNPTNPKGKEDLAKIDKADYILITHGHGDHVGDSVALAKKTGAKLVSSFELGTNLVRLWGFPSSQAEMGTLGNAGGELKLAGGEVTVAFTPAIHSSGLDYPDASESKETRPVVYGGSPVGFVLQIQNGPTIYHSGDTSYFKDMETIGDTYSPDLALLNIGGHFGMEPSMAARAATAVRAKVVVPMHYKTFPILVQDARPFFMDLDKRKISHVEMQPGSTITFEGKKLKR